MSGVAKLDLKGPGLQSLPALGERVLSWVLGPAHLLVTCDSNEVENAIGRLSSVPGVWVTDVTSVYAHFELAGPDSRDVLRKLTSLDVSGGALPDLACGQARIAHVHAILLRRDRERAPAFQLLVGREYGESVRDAVLHAGREFHLGEPGD